MIVLERNVIVKLEPIKHSEDEYVIKDKDGITIGRAYIVELSSENENCTARIKLYKNTQEQYIYLINVLRVLLNTLIKNLKLAKVNIIVDEETNIKAFIDMNFSLEGILSFNLSTDKNRKSELLFGINKEEYNIALTNVGKFILRGKLVDLKILTPEDAEKLADYYVRNKEHLRKFEPTRDEYFFSIENQREIILDSYRQYLNGNCANFGIFKDDRLIGKIQVSNIVVGVFKSGIVGYSIDEKEQGKGYMKDAVSALLDYCFEDLQLHRIEASTLVDNIKSQSVLKANGFEELGLNKKYLYINGEWRDHITFYRINHSET